MYSIVLTVAMTSGAEAPAFHNSWYNKCTLDMCWPMRYGWVSSGCKGAYWGGCYGCGHGCYSACYGCWGGCYGSCYGTGGYAWPLSYGVYPPIQPYGGYGHYSMGPAPTPGTTVPILPAPSGGTINPGIISPMPLEKELPKKPLTFGTETSRTASITVEVPAEAKVYIDSNLMKSTATRRTFTTPALEPNQDYYYWVRVVAEENGKTVEEAKKVIVRAGERAEPAFAFTIKDRPAFADAARTTGR